MKAAVHTRYGPPEVVSIEDVPRPEPGSGEIRIAVHATTVNRTDCGTRRAHPFFARPVTGWFRPRQTTLGMEFAGLVDAVGKTSYPRCRKVLKPHGVFSATDLGPGWQNIALAMWSSLTRSGRVVFPMPRSSKATIEFIAARIEAGELRAVIDRPYALDDIVEAYRYVENEQKTGIVVIDVASRRSPADPHGAAPDLSESA